MTKAKKQEARPFADRVLWYGIMVGGSCVLFSAVPAVPWRVSRTDTNIGNRFVMDRFYNLFGATDQFGKSVSWFTLMKKIERKTQEFGRPSPVSALVGTVGQELGSGGAAVGCFVWQACKDHTNQRLIEYQKVAICGMFTLASLLLGSLCCCMGVLCMTWEGGEAAGKKQKHKKKKTPKGEWSPKSKTMICCIAAYLISTIGAVAFLYQLDKSLKTFQQTAYYPYAMSHAAPYIAGLGSVILLVCMFISISRCREQDKKPEESQEHLVGHSGSDAYTPGYAQQGW